MWLFRLMWWSFCPLHSGGSVAGSGRSGCSSSSMADMCLCWTFEVCLLCSRSSSACCLLAAAALQCFLGLIQCWVGSYQGGEEEQAASAMCTCCVPAPAPGLVLQAQNTPVTSRDESNCQGGEKRKNLGWHFLFFPLLPLILRPENSW